MLPEAFRLFVSGTHDTIPNSYPEKYESFSCHSYSHNMALYKLPSRNSVYISNIIW